MALIILVFLASPVLLVVVAAIVDAIGDARFRAMVDSVDEEE